MEKEEELITIARELDKNGSIVLLKRFYYKNTRKLKHKKIRFQECVFIDTAHRHFLEFIIGTFPQEIKEIRPGYFRLRYMSKKAINFLEEIIPYLKRKKRQAELVLEYSKLKRQGGYRVPEHLFEKRMAVYNELKKEKLNLRKSLKIKEIV